jgi:hypothetical protein
MQRNFFINVVKINDQMIFNEIRINCVEQNYVCTD